MTIAEAAEQVLREAGTALHALQIAEVIEERSLFKFGTDNRTAVVSQALRKQCRDDAEGRRGRFIKTGPNTFGLDK